MIKIYYAYTDIINDTSFERIKADMSDDEIKRLNNLKRSEDRMLKVLSSALLSKALKEHGQNLYKLSDIKKDEAGRPFIDSACFDFNISHSSNCAVLAYTEDCRIGIDIEEKKVVDLSDFEYVFPKQLWKKIITSKDSLETFYHYWTLLESAVKADGRGLPILPLIKMAINIDKVNIDGKDWFSHHIDFDKALSCCIATDKTDKTIVLVNVRSI